MDLDYPNGSRWVRFALILVSRIPPHFLRFANTWAKWPGQETLLEWPSLQRSLYALLTTRWPLWHSLERLRNASGVQTVYVKQLEGQSVDLDVVFCGNGVEGLQQTLRGWCERKGWRLHFLRADLAACPSFYQSISLPNSGHVLMLSPLLWSMEGVEAAVDALNFSLFDEADVLGFPTLDATLLWTFAVQRIRRSPWSVRYEAFPTGYEETLKDRCFRADATSMSRAFQSATWQRLVQRLRPSQGVGKVEEEMAWFVDLDLEILAARLRVYLCMGPPIPEDPYLSRVRLVPWLARKYRLEEAHFTDSNVQQLCLGPADAGASPCAQQEGRMALATALAAWKDVRVLLDGAALLTAGRLSLGEDAAMQSLEVCSHDEGFLCSALETESIVLPMEVMVETEPSRCTFRSARDTGAAGTQLPPLLRVQRGGPACEGVEVFNMRLHNGMLLPVWQRPSSGDVEELAAHVLSCMALRLRLEAKTWRVHAPSDQLQGSECLEFLKRSVASLTEPVVLLSPFLLQEKWSDKTTQVLKRALLQLRLGDASVLSFPTSSELFSWRVRRLRHQYWKLEFSAVDEITDQRSLSGASCALGLASMTRVFAATTLQSLLSQVESDPEKPWNWLLDLDLQIHHAKIKAMSCADGPMPEVDYLPQISLTRHVSHKHQVEMADFDGRREVSCIKGANWFEVARKGLVAPYCFRRDVMKAFRQLRQWWTSLDARNFLVPEEGTFLALFRNGDAGIMPWDSDFDVKLYTEQDITMEGFMNRTLEPAFQSMQIEAYAYDGCGQDSYVLLRQANITHHIGDAYVRGSQRRHPWRARLFGTEISLSPEHLEHIFFTRYRTPVAKLFGDGIALQCFLQGHNACMPDCRDPNLPCDFEDNFVHV